MLWQGHRLRQRFGAKRSYGQPLFNGVSEREEAVNTALRAGLDRLEAPAKRPAKRYTLHAVSLGPRLPNLDNVADVLAAIEGEGTK